eukprot:Hpha_TRINITY_DN16087_c4_g3::TRINITY_DN16087_c4_g3_i1::g.118602::m.118602
MHKGVTWLIVVFVLFAGAVGLTTKKREWRPFTKGDIQRGRGRKRLSTEPTEAMSPLPESPPVPTPLPPPAAPISLYPFRPKQDRAIDNVIYSHTIKPDGPLGNMLVQYAWSFGIALLANATLYVKPFCPNQNFVKGGKAFRRFRKYRSSSKMGRSTCLNILKDMEGDGGQDVRDRSPLFQKAQQQLSSLPVDESWFAYGGHLTRNGSATWGWSWEDDPYGVLFITRNLFRKALLPVLARTRTSCDPSSVAIHFRCSDIPFCRGEYTLMRHSWYKSALDHVPKSAYTDGKVNICLFTCNTHQPSPCFREVGSRSNSTTRQSNATLRSAACKYWADALKDDLLADKRVGSVETVCGTVERDFAVMIKAPVLISSGSSLSFTAALLRDQGTAILPLPMRPAYWTRLAGKPHTFVPPPESGIQLIPAPRVRHEEIEDYYEVEKVLQVIRS